MDDMPPHSGIVRDPLVYLVEDDAAVRNALALLVRSFGWRVDAFANGEQFLTQAPRPWQACVVLDLLMPGISGFDVARAIRIKPWGKHALLISLSGLNRDIDLQLARKAGFDVNMTKPADPAQIRMLLDRP